ncbi:Glyoxalase-like domain protein [Clostridiales bacterium CHKCI001]|nr:Glyoxalase-like domain protein [Clostridiales bacterium CHKCI001]
MHLKNILIVVSDIEKSKRFYQELFGLMVAVDFGGNVILTEGLVLQEKKAWENLIGREVKAAANDAELYFEENDMDGLIKKLESGSFPINYVNPPMEQERRVIRIYDPDGHIIEIAETLECVVRRYLMSGMTVSETAKKMRLPIDVVKGIEIGLQESLKNLE